MTQPLPDPAAFAKEWSFNARFYAWLSLFHGMGFMFGRDISAHDAFSGSIYHTQMFGPNGAVFVNMKDLDPAGAEMRLSFAESVMHHVRENEKAILMDRAELLRDMGRAFFGAWTVISILFIFAALGRGDTMTAALIVPVLFVPLGLSMIGKRIVRGLWSATSRAKGDFFAALPWTATNKQA